MDQKLSTLTFLLFVGAATSLYAQQANDAADTAQYHYKDGPYGYRAEIQLMDSLAVLEMSNQITPAEAKERKEKFRKEKETKQKQKKDKQRKKRKQEKEKKDKNKS